LQITFCPPATSKVLSDEPNFYDRRRHAAVSAHIEAGGEVVSTGIAFSDYQNMSTKSRAATYRQKSTPEYAVDNNKMRALLVRFVESRAFSKKRIAAVFSGSDAHRLRRAHQAVLADVPRLEALATRLCVQYVEAKTGGRPKSFLKSAAIEIEIIDSQIIMSRKLPEIIVGVIYRSYCAGENSVEVAQALGLKPPAVRQLLHRLSKVWKKMQTEKAAPTVAGHLWKSRTRTALLFYQERKAAGKCCRHGCEEKPEKNPDDGTWRSYCETHILHNRVRQDRSKSARRARVTARG
jgi:hypothetical protein